MAEVVGLYRPRSKHPIQRARLTVVTHGKEKEMKRRNLTILAVVAVLATAAVPFLYAQPHGRGMHSGSGERGDDLGPLNRLVQAKEQLGLSDQQVDEIKAIFGALRDQNEQYRDQLRSGHEAI